jgi:hypothetical protein
MRSLAFAVTAAALSLSACQTVSEITGGSSARHDEPKVAAPAAAAPPLAPAPAVNSATGLTGLPADALRAAWGEPSLKRNETGAELWQYGGSGSCTLLVYLYANASSVMTVTHAEAVPGGAGEAAVASCAQAAGKPPLKPIS